MKTKYLVFGGIALTVTAIGMAGAATAVYCFMNRRPPEYTVQPPKTPILPVTVTSPARTPSPEKSVEQIARNEQPNLSSAEQTYPDRALAQKDSSHSIIING